MKTYLPVLLLAWALPFTGMAQIAPYQRMAVPRGNYFLAANETSRFTAYCLDHSRATPTKGVLYTHILSGDYEAVVTIGSETMTLRDAIHQNLVSIEGVSLVEEAEPRHMLQQLIASTELLEPEATERLDKLRSLEQRWDVLPSRQREVIHDLLTKLAVENKGTNALLSFSNLSGQDLEIVMRNHVELSVEDEYPVGVTDALLSQQESEQRMIQRELWMMQLERRQAMLKQLGYFPHDINGHRTLRTKKVYEEYQLANNLEPTASFDAATEASIKAKLDQLSTALGELGFVGTNLSEQIKAWQVTNNLLPDGYLEQHQVQTILDEAASSRSSASLY